MKKKLIWLLLILLIGVSACGGYWFANQNKTAEPAQASLSTNKSVQENLSGLPKFCADKEISVSGCDGQTELITDQGNTYNLVEIGNQCWFSDNSKEIPTTDKGWYGFYDNAKEEASPGEGLLYTWDAAMNSKAEERAQGVCPTGWHVPSECEFTLAFESNTNAEEKLSRTISVSAYNHKRNLAMEKETNNKLWTSSQLPSDWKIFVSPNYGTVTSSKFFPNGSQYNALSLKCLKN